MGFKIQEEVKKGIGASRRTEHQDVPWDRIYKSKKKKAKKRMKAQIATATRNSRSRGNPDPH